jgi:hypothetical protein
VQRVFILEDNDEPGRAFAQEKARALAGIVPNIRIVTFPVPESEDVTYWLEHNHTKEELIARCEACAPIRCRCAPSTDCGAIVLRSARLESLPACPTSAKDSFFATSPRE